MPLFEYKARAQNGESVTGNLEANSADIVASQLMSNGVTPIEIAETTAKENYFDELKQHLSRRKPGLDDLILFSRQLYTLMRSGVPIIRALNGLAANMDNPVLAEIIRDLVMDLESGHNLAGAMSHHPETFNDLMVNMVQVGENTGRLDDALLHLSQYLEREKDTRDRIKSAMRYPIFVIVAILIAIFVINYFVIPTFASMFAKFDAELPWQTKLLISSSNFMVDYWYLIFGGLLGGIFGFRHYIKTKNGKYKWDRTKLRIPAVGTILHESLLQRFATSFSMTMRSGVPLIQGLNVVARAADNAYVEDRILSMRNGIERGDTLTNTATATELFTPLVLQMIAVGEETGAVDDMLDNVADFYEREVDYKLKNLSSAIEPILIIVVGVMVLILAMGVFLPMWDIYSVMQR